MRVFFRQPNPKSLVNIYYLGFLIFHQIYFFANKKRENPIIKPKTSLWRPKEIAAIRFLPLESRIETGFEEKYRWVGTMYTKCRHIKMLTNYEGCTKLIKTIFYLEHTKQIENLIRDEICFKNPKQCWLKYSHRSRIFAAFVMGIRNSHTLRATLPLIGGLTLATYMPFNTKRLVEHNKNT